MKEIIQIIDKNLVKKVTSTGKQTNVILGIVFGCLVVLGVYNMGHHFGEYLYYLLR